MKRQINAASEYNEYFTIQHGPTKHFGVHFNDDGPYEGSFIAQITEIHPYDDADYAWARINYNGQAEFIKDGKVVDKLQLHDYDEEDYENGIYEYYNDCLDTVAVELMHINRNVEPRMIHN